jgi:hypothetical protein
MYMTQLDRVDTLLAWIDEHSSVPITKMITVSWTDPQDLRTVLGGPLPAGPGVYAWIRVPECVHCSPTLCEPMIVHRLGEADNLRSRFRSREYRMLGNVPSFIISYHAITQATIDVIAEVAQRAGARFDPSQSGAQVEQLLMRYYSNLWHHLPVGNERYENGDAYLAEIGLREEGDVQILRLQPHERAEMVPIWARGKPLWQGTILVTPEMEHAMVRGGPVPNRVRTILRELLVLQYPNFTATLDGHTPATIAAERAMIRRMREDRPYLAVEIATLIPEVYTQSRDDAARTLGIPVDALPTQSPFDTDAVLGTPPEPHRPEAPSSSETIVTTESSHEEIPDSPANNGPAKT